LLVAGSGSQLLPCQRLAQQCGDRVQFHSPWNTSDHPEKVLLAADLLVLPTRGQQSLASVPSKLLSYMLSGRPILAAALPNSDLANLIIQSGCGWVVDPDRPDLLAEKVREIKKLESDDLNRLGQLGRSYVLQHFSKDICLPKAINILKDIANGS
jgi:colanic acid biosynthesis glycosyl transferase WcaI